jgi:hypothetical protein
LQPTVGGATRRALNVLDVREDDSHTAGCQLQDLADES